MKASDLTKKTANSCNSDAGIGGFLFDPKLFFFSF
jgi:hypothetical protein